MKRWARSEQIFGSEGQALVELSIFGGILLMILGVLISSGLNADFNQSITMEAFRKALKGAEKSGENGQPTSNSYVVVEDRHIPSPSHPLALGSVIPFTGSASVTRNYRMQEGATSQQELPRTTYVMQGKEYPFTTSGFRQETIVDNPALLEKYRLVYGGGSICSKKTCLDKFNPPIPEYAACVPLIDPDTGEYVLDVETGAPVCDVGQRNIMVVDPCEGEIINYDACVRQSRMIVDPAVCTEECNKAGNVSSDTRNNANKQCEDSCKNVSEPQKPQCITDCVNNIINSSNLISADCNSTCSAGGMLVPWYATPYNPGGVPAMFPTLASLLPIGGTQMGLQPTTTQKTTKNNTIRKEEDPAGITSTMSGVMGTQTTRIVRKAANRQGVDQPIDSTKDVSTNATWRVSW